LFEPAGPGKITREVMLGLHRGNDYSIDAYSPERLTMEAVPVRSRRPTALTN